MEGASGVNSRGNSNPNSVYPNCCGYEAHNFTLDNSFTHTHTPHTHNHTLTRPSHHKHTHHVLSSCVPSSLPPSLVPCPPFSPTSPYSILPLPRSVSSCPLPFFELLPRVFSTPHFHADVNPSPTITYIGSGAQKCWRAPNHAKVVPTMVPVQGHTNLVTTKFVLPCNGPEMAPRTAPKSLLRDHLFGRS